MDIGILLWNTCNARCAHCAVSSGPDASREMSNADIIAIIDGAFIDSTAPNIGLSGGEAFYHYDDLRYIVSYATSRGANISINTNCFWATSDDEAARIVSDLKAIKVKQIVVSFDTYHAKYINEECVVRAISACRKAHLKVELQFVSSRKTKHLHEFLKDHADLLLNVTCREIPCHPAGRAANMSSSSMFLSKDIPHGLCPNAVLSVSADGRYIPCCNAAGHLPSLSLGTIGDDQSKIYNNFCNSPVMHILWARGPQAFLSSAANAGYSIPNGGYIDQCHLCHDLFKDDDLALVLKEYAENEVFGVIYNSYCEEISDSDSSSARRLPALGLEGIHDT